MLGSEAARGRGVRRRGIAGIAALGLSMLSLAPSPAVAGDNDFGNTPVRQRKHPGYDPIGIRMGAFTVFPSVSVGLQYDSNVFASVDAISDWALVTTPELLFVRELGESRYSLEVGARNYAYRDLDSENRTDAHALFRLSRPITGDLKWDAAFEAAHRHAPRGDSFSLTTAAEPIPYNDLRAESSVTRTFNRFGVTIGGKVRHLSYEDVEAFGGGILDQSYRDGTIITTSVKPFYSFSTGHRAYVRIDLSKRDYEGVATLNRDAQGYDARAGLDFRLTSMLLGSAELGYLSYDYDNPAIPSVDGVSAGAKLMWLMTPLMTVTFFAERNVAEVAAPDQEGRLDLLAGAQLDYEILRNLILSLEGAYKLEDFVGTPRTDEVVKLSARLDYLLNANFNFGLNYNYIDRESDNPAYDFDKHVVMFNVTAQR